MNVYDFDQTIYYPDSVLSFAIWIMPKRPSLIYKYLFPTIKALIMWKSGKIKRYRFERQLNRIFHLVPDVEQEINKYWDTHMDHLSEWYLKQKRSDDLIISASPECFLKPLTDRLNVNLIATKYDIEMGVVVGNINLAKEKARHIIEAGMPMIEAFYSDSLSDTPLALLAEQAYLVKDKAQITVPWPEIDDAMLNEIKRMIDIGEEYRYHL